MEFTNGTLAGLMATATDGLEVEGQRANLRMEERTSAVRQSGYEDRMGAPNDWADWREGHYRYVQQEVRRRYPLSAAFAGGEPSLRPGIEPNQHLYRVERIDSLLDAYGTTTGEPVGCGTDQGLDRRPGFRPPGRKNSQGIGRYRSSGGW